MLTHDLGDHDAMPSPPLPPAVGRTRARRSLVVAMAATLGTGFIAAPAHAKLIPPPGPWPTSVTGAANPLTGTPFALNGSHATANASLRVWLSSGRRRVTAMTRTVGQRTVLRGRLRNRDTRRSIAGATLTVAAQDVYAPGSWFAVTNVRTSRRGRFRAVLPPGYHRRAAVLYFPAVTSTAPVFSRRLLIRARSRVWLAAPFHKRRAYRFDGRVSAGGTPVPAGGLIVGLQVRNRQRTWVTARIARTTASGRFRIRYSFARRARLTARVIAPAQSGWALYAGYSRPRTIAPR